MRKLFEGYSFSDAEVKNAIENLYKNTGELLDPHSIIGVLAGQRGHADPENIMIALATAHPAKFPTSVEGATGIKPQLPADLIDLFKRKENFDILPNNIDDIRGYIINTLEKSNSK